MNLIHPDRDRPQIGPSESGPLLRWFSKRKQQGSRGVHVVGYRGVGIAARMPLPRFDTGGPRRLEPWIHFEELKGLWSARTGTPLRNSMFSGHLHSVLPPAFSRPGNRAVWPFSVAGQSTVDPGSNHDSCPHPSRYCPEKMIVASDQSNDSTLMSRALSPSERS